uniref:Uncharacterized protein n=1 Tax=Mammaliicoccus phage MSShimriz1 TaxID=3230127 RepID=A0AAU8GRM4_9VIRU
MNEKLWGLFINSFEEEKIITIDNRQYRLRYTYYNWVGEGVDIIDVQSDKYLGNLMRDSYLPVGAPLRIRYEEDDTLPKIISNIKRYLEKEESEKDKEKDKLNNFLYGGNNNE